MRPSTEDGPLLGGHVSVERYDIIYNFRDSQVPEEIIELRQVRATRNGAHDFGLAHSHTGTDHFHQTTEVLFGGQLTAIKRQTAEGKTLYTQRVTFDRVLGRGDHHAFGVRYWVERDPVPPDSIMVEMTIPARLVAIHANFWGSTRPASLWHYGPLPDQALLPGSPTAANRLATDQTASAWFEQPAIGSVFGLAWRW